MKKILPIALVAAVAIVAAWFILGGGKDADSTELTLHGNVDIREVSLAFEGSGRVLEMRAEEGDRVRAGQILAVLDTTDMALQAKQAGAQIAVARQNLAKLRNGTRPEDLAQAQDRLTAAEAEAARAGADFTRLKSISGATDGRGVSQRELDQARAAAQAASAQAGVAREALRSARNGARKEDVAAAAAQVDAADAQQGLLNHRIAQGTLRAPVDGVVRARLIEPGDMASPQRPAYGIALTHPKWVRVYVGEADLGRVRQGIGAQVVSDSRPDRPVKGRVGYIASVAEFTPKSVETEDLRTSLVYEVRVIVEDPQDALRLGQPVTVRLATGAAR
ncbi:membrane protein [Novosphingobium colocasiae]|uniref:Membrane protein n=2 Tax=Novosphingobium colocasiae TaxID=1256513 RepID=A0A918PMW9_9SPHN|nr:membrane protein [Novosphingobium colocasiae]